MEPIGLTFKTMKYNPFTDKFQGELMVVHQCLNCGKISYNRIAGDDNPYAITCLLENPTKTTDLKDANLLDQSHKQEVLDCLYGY